MNALKEYFLSVMAMALLNGLLLSLFPNGNVGRVVRFIGGMLLVLSVLSPMVRIDTDRLMEANGIKTDVEDIQTQAEAQSREMFSRLIKEQCEAYILDKAEQLGVEINVDISMREDGEYPYPDGVTIHGKLTQGDQVGLSNIIEQDLGISKQRQEWISSD